MSSHLDIVGSIILAAMLMFSMARFNADRQAALISVSSQVNNQQYLKSATELLMWDLRKAGYRVTSGSTFLRAEERRVVFRGDIDNNGIVDTVSYSFSGPVAYTPNPNDTLLIRQVNRARIDSSDLGITSFRLRYYTATGGETSTASAVRTVRVTIRVQAKYDIDGDFRDVFADLRISPRNLRL